MHSGRQIACIYCRHSGAKNASCRHICSSAFKRGV
ncbi:hypothetical protein cbdbA1467 [Dehalococcoides mccartyi CBDB1]|uniref:Uncharacterized protein n=1 Tax=Dehalococcoides mccartyi (strain CBDB1) TaxID=255470 RepID=A0A916KN51_DEHMC|nr:hypothetical protein cbdbA1467 [Dehalococcoides mccartyi CBDB1]